MCWLINLLYADAGPTTMYDMPRWMLEYYLVHCV